MKNAMTATTSKKYAFTFDHVNQKIVGKDVDFFAWIATFGHGAKILHPATAIEKIRRFIADVNDMYNDEGEK